MVPDDSLSDSVVLISISLEVDKESGVVGVVSVGGGGCRLGNIA
jgi:hypothetical protein